MTKYIPYLFFASVFFGSCTSDDTQTELAWIHVPAGSFEFGVNDGKEEEGPSVSCQVESFYLSKTEVSNAQFERFVTETGYVTSAEKSGGMVYDDAWELVQNANWKSPTGKKIARQKWLNLPVVQVSYEDVQAYCRWSNTRLPREIEWEYAAKMGKSNEQRMNITDARTEIAQTVSVNSFEENALGLYHQSGNVWEWCLDSYNFSIHDKLQFDSKNLLTEGYLGASFDPSKKDELDTLRVIKGGSFLCQAGHCAGYRPAARQSASQEESYFHIGFRVVKDQL